MRKCFETPDAIIPFSKYGFDIVLLGRLSRLGMILDQIVPSETSESGVAIACDFVPSSPLERFMKQHGLGEGSTMSFIEMYRELRLLGLGGFANLHPELGPYDFDLDTKGDL